MEVKICINIKSNEKFAANLIINKLIINKCKIL